MHWLEHKYLPNVYVLSTFTSWVIQKEISILLHLRSQGTRGCLWVVLAPPRDVFITWVSRGKRTVCQVKGSISLPMIWKKPWSIPNVFCLGEAGVLATSLPCAIGESFRLLCFTPNSGKWFKLPEFCFVLFFFSFSALHICFSFLK